MKNNNAYGNVGVGWSSLEMCTTSDGNTAIGWYSGRENTSGEHNTYLGGGAGRFNQTGNDNVFIGYNTGSCSSAHSKSANVFVGCESGSTAKGSNNVFLGYHAGYSNQNGLANIFIGYQAGQNETGSNKLYIENSSSATPLIYGEFDNDIIKINGTFIKANDVITDNDATPDVSTKNVWTYNGTANSVTVTDIDNPETGAIYTIIGNSDTHTITINDSGNFNLSANWTGGIDDVITIYVQADNDYIEISRIDN